MVLGEEEGKDTLVSTRSGTEAGNSFLSGWRARAIVSPFMPMDTMSQKRDVELNPHQHIDIPLA